MGSHQHVHGGNLRFPVGLVGEAVSLSGVAGYGHIQQGLGGKSTVPLSQEGGADGGGGFQLHGKQSFLQILFQSLGQVTRFLRGCLLGFRRDCFCYRRFLTIIGNLFRNSRCFHLLSLFGRLHLGGFLRIALCGARFVADFRCPGCCGDGREYHQETQRQCQKSLPEFCLLHECLPFSFQDSQKKYMSPENTGKQHKFFDITKNGYADIAFSQHHRNRFQ